MGAAGAERRYEGTIPEEQSAKLQGKLNVLWTENKSMVLEKMDLMEREFWDWLRRPDERTTGIIAGQTAHKMAGVLGAFGMKRASMIASTLERIVSMRNRNSQYGSGTVYALLSELREIVEAKS